MNELLNPDRLQALVETSRAWLDSNVFVSSTLVQALVVAAAFVVARLLAPRLRRTLESLAERGRYERQQQVLSRALMPLALPVIWLFAQWVSVLVAAEAGWPNHLITIVVSLLTAWVVIRLTTSLVRDPWWSRLVAVIAWSVAALNILDLLDPAIALLDGIAVTLGDLRVSALTIIKGIIILGVFLWLATVGSRLLERRIQTLPNLTPAIQVLFAKLLKIVLVIIAVVAALNSVGIDLTAFAVLSGAIGVGIGFGLQKIVANLISGVILLLDRSIKPGDVVGVGDTYGWIESLGARYVSVVTRDGVEHLIPNEELITNRVENWSYSNRQVRLKIPVGVSYGSNVEKARDLCLEAAREAERVLAKPQSVCLLKGFGDSSVDLELRIWINDPTNGVSNVKSDVLFRIWKKFHEHSVEIPFPQRDLHIKPPAALSVQMANAASA